MTDQGGSGFRGVMRVKVLVSVVDVGIGRNREQLLCLRNKPSFSDASSDWKMTGNLHGRGKYRLLSLVYCEHWKRMWWRVCK